MTAPKLRSEAANRRRKAIGIDGRLAPARRFTEIMDSRGPFVAQNQIVCLWQCTPSAADYLRSLRKQSPAECTGTRKERIGGMPDTAQVSTTYATPPNECAIEFARELGRRHRGLAPVSHGVRRAREDLRGLRRTATGRPTLLVRLPRRLRLRVSSRRAGRSIG